LADFTRSGSVEQGTGVDCIQRNAINTAIWEFAAYALKHEQNCSLCFTLFAAYALHADKI